MISFCIALGGFLLGVISAIVGITLWVIFDHDGLVQTPKRREEIDAEFNKLN